MVSFTENDIEAMIAARKKRPLHPFEPLEPSPVYRLPNFQATIKSILSKGYQMRPSYLFPLDQPLPWKHADRSVSYNMHSFAPVAPLLMGHSLHNNEKCFALALSFLKDWLTCVREPTKEELAGEWNEANGDFLWYDMGAGLRGYRLAYMIDVLMRAKEPDIALLQRLMTIMDWHRQLATREEAFFSHNNHGLYQSLGQIAMSRRFNDLPDFAASEKQGEARLDVMLQQQFFPDGVHREHSPGYHWMLLTTLHEAKGASLIRSTEHLDKVIRIEDAMAWLVQPNGFLPAFGDTDGSEYLVSGYKPGEFKNPELQYALSEGKSGKAFAEQIRLFPDAGYAILRTQNPKTQKDETYLAQAAGFHSKTHKHADHLTFTWFDKGEEILVDAGRFGYKGKTEKNSDLWEQGFWYADPQRIYVEKTSAHNTIEIDKKDYPRRKAKPFGSALRRHAIHNGVYAIETECRHFRSIRHIRLLLAAPRRFLIVFDWLKDNTGAKHDFRQWFHLGTALDLSSHGDALTIMRHGKPFGSILSLVPDVQIERMVRGQNEPEMQGWTSHKKGGVLLPNWAFPMLAAHRSQAVFVTLFSLAPHAAVTKPAEIAPSGQSGKIFWQDRSAIHTLGFTRRPGETLNITYSRKTENDA